MGESTKRPIILWISVLLGVLLLVSACNLGRPAEDVCVGSGTLFEDDFSDETRCGWALYNQGGAVVAIREGVLQISTSQPGQIWWTNPNHEFDDMMITVQARQAGGPNDNAYGVICRYQNAENFYVFLVSGDGFYAIGKYQTGNAQIIYLTPDGQYQPSEAINQGVGTNQLRASCVGNELSLAVNGIPLLSVTDSTFVRGDVGLSVSTLQPGTAVVQFDNIRIQAP